jgi:peptide/nickel transport system substrate-binding protein
VQTLQQNQRRRLAAASQARALEVVPYVPIGMMSLVRGHSARLSGILEAAVPVYWNIAKGGVNATGCGRG